MEEAEYEFMVTQVDLLKDIQQKRLGSVVFDIPIENINRELTDEINDMCQQHKGQKPLRIQVYDEGRRHQVTLRVQGSGIQMDPELYHWVQSKTDTFQLRIDS